MQPDITAYHAGLPPETRAICEALASELERALVGAERKVWHGAPVWFLDGNPVAGYSTRKAGVVLLFWSGQSFEEDGLEPEGKFKAAQRRYSRADEVEITPLRRWIEKAKTIQWDYKNIVKRKGVLEKLGAW